MSTSSETYKSLMAELEALRRSSGSRDLSEAFERIDVLSGSLRAEMKQGSEWIEESSIKSSITTKLTPLNWICPKCLSTDVNYRTTNRRGKRNHLKEHPDVDASEVETGTPYCVRCRKDMVKADKEKIAALRMEALLSG